MLKEESNTEISILHRQGESIRQAMSEQGRPLDEFTAEFEARHGISR